MVKDQGQGLGSRSIFWHTVVNIRGLALPSAVKSNITHYQSKLFVCVSVISGRMRMRILRMLLINKITLLTPMLGRVLGWVFQWALGWMLGWVLGECWVDVGGVGWMLGLSLGWLRRVHMLLRSCTVIDLHILALYQHP